jgi:hypothetical protein
MNITNLDYVGDYTILYNICRFSAIIITFITLNVMIMIKDKYRKQRPYKYTVITGFIIAVISIIGWLALSLARTDNVYKFANDIQANMSTDYKLTSEAYTTISRLYDDIAVGKDYSSKELLLYNKVSNQEVKVELIYKNNVIKIRGIL